MIAHNIKKETFRRVKSQFQAGVTVVEHGNKGRKSLLPKTVECIAWLEFFVSSIGDHQPDNKTVHLPSCFSRTDVYKRMLGENNEFGQPTVSMSHFYSLWDKHFSHVLIPKENRFTKCTDCTKYKLEKEKTMDKGKRSQIEHLLKMHLELVWQERRVYYLHRYKSRKFPAKYMACITDGMDQKTTNVPSLRRLSKAMSALSTVGTHLVGSIIHSGQGQYGKEIFGSFDYYQWPHDSNLTITVLLDALCRWCKEYRLPPILYLQVDNCVRENKNKFMYAVLALMVECKIFEKIRLNFLPVGHTHEDIDAFFGVFSKHLDKLDVYTVEDLLEALGTCMSHPVPKPYMLPLVYDIKAWISEHTVELHEHTLPKSFKFEMNEAGKAVMSYRNWSHEQWEGPIVILKTFPTGKPDLVPLSLAKLDVAALERDMQKYQYNMPEAAFNVWKQWVEKAKSETFVPDEYDWAIDILKLAVRSEPVPLAEQLPDELLELRDREVQPTREIYTGNYRNPRNRVDLVQLDDNFLEKLHVGCFAAIFFENFEKMPVIGKVIDVEENYFRVHYWKGTYLGKWFPQHVPRRKNEPWLERLPKTCIVCCGFPLAEGSKLLPATRQFLKDRYSALRDQSTS